MAIKTTPYKDWAQIDDVIHAKILAERDNLPENLICFLKFFALNKEIGEDQLGPHRKNRVVGELYGLVAPFHRLGKIPSRIMPVARTNVTHRCASQVGVAFAEFHQNPSQLEIFLAIPLENVDHSQPTEGEKIVHGLQVIPKGQDLLAILNALFQQFQFGAAPDDIGVAHANGGITPILAHFQGLKANSIRFFHPAGIEQGDGEPDIKASQKPLIRKRLSQRLMFQKQSLQTSKIGAVIKYRGPFIEKIYQEPFLFL